MPAQIFIDVSEKQRRQENHDCFMFNGQARCKATGHNHAACTNESPIMSDGANNPFLQKRAGHNALILDGKACADALIARIASHTRALVAGHGARFEDGAGPGLAVVLVGDDPASHVYVRNKTKAAERCGFSLYEHHMPADTAQETLEALVKTLDADVRVHGILVQLPLPKGLHAASILAHISSRKDVDGFDPLNLGYLASGRTGQGFVACTPAGAMILLRHALDALRRPLAGARAVVVGRSTTVGRPMGLLLLNADCTVTFAHSRTQNLDEVVAGCDIVVAAVGRAGLIKGEWIKAGAVVIDVGITKTERADGRSYLTGDVEFEGAAARAGAISPVPGGVGPMTIAMLMANTLNAACRSVGFAAFEPCP